MSSQVEFILKLKDQMSVALRGVSGNARSAFASVDRGIANMQRGLNKTVVPVGQLNKRLDDLTKKRDLAIGTRAIKDANRDIEKLENKINRMQTMGRKDAGGGFGIGGKMGGMLAGAGRMAAGAALGLGIAGTALAGSSIASGMQGSAQKTSFQVLGGQQEGSKLYGDLTNYAQKSIYGNEVYQNAQTMLAFGASVKEVLPDVKMLGDIAMGNKERLGSLSLAFSQTRAAGKLMGQDLLQYVAAGFNPLQQMSERTGISMAKLREKMSDGAISFGMVKQAFLDATSAGGKFYGMTEKIGETPFGKWEAFKGQLQGLKLQLGTALLPTASKVIDSMSRLAGYIPKVIDSITPFFDSMATQVGPAISQVVSNLKEMLPHLRGVFNAAMGIAKPIWEALSSPQIKGLAKDVLDLSTSMMVTLKPAIEMLAESAKHAATALSYVLKSANFVVKSIHSDLNVETAADNYLARLRDKKTAPTAGMMGNMKALSPMLYNSIKPNSGNRVMVNPYNPGMRSLVQNAAANRAALPAGMGAATGAKLGAAAGYAGLDESNSKITGGGPKVINIKMDAMVKDLTINVNGNKEAATEVAGLVRTELLRVLGDMGYTAGE